MLSGIGYILHWIVEILLLLGVLHLWAEGHCCETVHRGENCMLAANGWAATECSGAVRSLQEVELVLGPWDCIKE